MKGFCQQMRLKIVIIIPIKSQWGEEFNLESRHCNKPSSQDTPDVLPFPSLQTSLKFRRHHDWRCTSQQLETSISTHSETSVGLLRDRVVGVLGLTEALEWFAIWFCSPHIFRNDFCTLWCNSNLSCGWDDGVNFPDVMDSDTDGKLGRKQHTRGFKLNKWNSGIKVFFILYLCLRRLVWSCFGKTDCFYPKPDKQSKSNCLCWHCIVTIVPQRGL